MNKTLASFVAVALGWLAGFGYNVAYQKLFSKFGYLTDVAFWLYWPALWCFILWLVVVLPFTSYAENQGWEFAGWKGIFFGAFCGLSLLFITTFLLGMTSLLASKERFTMFGGYAMVVGAVTVFFYGILRRCSKDDIS